MTHSIRQNRLENTEQLIIIMIYRGTHRSRGPSLSPSHYQSSSLNFCCLLFPLYYCQCNVNVAFTRQFQSPPHDFCHSANRHYYQSWFWSLSASIYSSLAVSVSLDLTHCQYHYPFSYCQYQSRIHLLSASVTHHCLGHKILNRLDALKKSNHKKQGRDWRSKWLGK